MFEANRAPCSRSLINRLSLFFIPFSLFIFSSVALNSQCAHTHNEIVDCVQQASKVFSGKIISQHAEWDTNSEHIFTFSKVLVYDQLGNSLPKELLLRTSGGKIGNQIEWLQPSLRLHVGESGVFLANQIGIHSNGLAILQGVAVEQSFLPRDSKSGMLINPINEEHYFLEDWMLEMATLKNQEISSFKSFEYYVSNTKSTNPVIDNISPTSVPAGVFQTVIIQGSCFGDSPGGQATVQFLDPDFFGNVFGYLDVPPNHIVSWSDTEIEVIVPGRDVGTNFPGAGSGTIRVVTPTGEAVESSEELAVPFNKMVYGFEELRLIDENGFGGYTFSYNTDFNNAEAIAAIERGVESWRCAIQSSFVLSGQTSSVSCAVKDGVNIISFDSDCNLPFGLLSQSTHWIEICDNQAFVREVDILFSDVFNWNYGPAGSGVTEKDFETTIVHELGHAHGMGHVLNIDGTMYPSLAFGFDNRDIDSASDVCGDIIMEESEQELDCGEEEGVIPSPECDADCELNVTAIITSGCDSNGNVAVLISVADVNGSSSGFEILINGVQYGEIVLFNPLGQTTVEIDLPADGTNYNIEIVDAADSSCDRDVNIEVPNCQCGISIDVNQISNCDSNGMIDYGILIEDQNGSSEGFELLLDGDVLETGLNYDSDGSTNYQIELVGNGLVQEIEIIDLADDNCSASAEFQVPDCACELNFEVLEIGACNGESFELSIEIFIQNTGGGGFAVNLDGQFFDGPFPYAMGSTILNLEMSGDGNSHSIHVVDNGAENCSSSVNLDFPDCACVLQSELSNMQCAGDDGVVEVSLQLTHENNGNSFIYEINNSNQLIESDFQSGSETSLNLTLMGAENYTIEFTDSENLNCTSVLEFSTPACSCELNAMVTDFSDCNADGNVIVTIELQHENNSGSFSYAIDGSNELITQNYDSGNSTEIQLELDGGIHTVDFIDDFSGACQTELEFQTVVCMCDLFLDYELVVDCTPNNTQLFEVAVQVTQDVNEFNLFVDGQLSSDSPIAYQASSQTVIVELDGNGGSYEIVVENVGLICSETVIIQTDLCNFIPPCELEVDHTIVQNCATTNALTYEISVSGGNLDSPGCEVYFEGAEIEGSPFNYDASGGFSFPYDFVGDGSLQVFEFLDLLDTECLIIQTIELENCSCDLSIDDFTVSDCMGSGVEVELNFEVQSGSQGGYSIFLDGAEIDTGNYPEDGIWSIVYNVSGDESEYEFEIVDNENGSCSDLQIVVTPDCTPCFLSMQLEVSDCNDDAEVDVTAVIESANSETGQFDLLIGNDPLPDSPFSYDSDGNTEIQFTLPGSGEVIEITAVDAGDNLCIDTDQLNLPLCEIEECSLDLDFELIDDCQDNESTYEITVNVIDPFSNGFNFYINGELSNLGPFDYDENGATQFEVQLPAFGDDFVLAVSDQFQSECYDEETIEVEDCDCSLNAEIQQLGGCDDNQMLPFQLSVEDENGEEGFELFINGEETSNSPFDYSASGTTQVLIELSGDGSEYEIEIVDLNNECNEAISVEVPECDIELPCDLMVESQLLEACGLSNIETYSILISGGAADSEGLIITMDDAEIQGSPFEYDADGNVAFDYSHPADGSLLVFECTDISNAECLVTEVIELSECICNIKITKVEIGDCLGSGEAELTIEVTASGISGSGFLIFVEGVQVGDVFDYSASGVTVVSIPIGGIGQEQELMVQDFEMEDCNSVELFVEPNCAPCTLDLTAESAGCENEQAAITCSLNSENGSAAGFLLFVDGESLPGGPFSYDDSGLSEFGFFWPSTGSTVEVLVQDAGNEDCSSISQVVLPDCSPEDCMTTLTATQLTDCSDGSLIDYSIQITGGQIESTFSFSFDGFAVGANSYPYDASGITFVQLSVMGNGSLSELALVDNNNGSCDSALDIQLPDCGSNFDCGIEVDLIPLADCVDGFSSIGVSVTSVNGSENGFSVRVDGQLLDGTFPYDPSGVTYIEVPVPGDAVSHMVSILDMSDINCQALDSVIVASCDPDGECVLEVLDWLISDCESGNLSLELKVNSEFLTEQSFQVLVNGVVLNDEPIQGSGERILSFELPCNTGLAVIELIPTSPLDEACRSENTISINGELLVYPNPFGESDGLIHIQGIDPSDYGKQMVFEIYTASGDLIHLQELEGQVEIEVELNSHWFPSGVYFFRLSSESNSYSKKTMAIF